MLIIISGALISCKKSDKNPDPIDIFAGSWRIDSAVIEEYVEDTLYFRYARKIDSARIDFFRDKLYKSYDRENSIVFFSLEGVEGAKNQVEGGIWMPEYNYTQIRLDKNVPEFNKRAPSILHVSKLTSNEFNFVYDDDPWIFQKDTSKIDSVGLKFVYFQALLDGAYGLTIPDTSYQTGLKFGRTIGYDIGYYNGLKDKNKLVPTARLTYALRFFDGYYRFLSTQKAFVNFDKGFRTGYLDPVYGNNAGRIDGNNSNLNSRHRYYKLIYKSSKQKSL